MITIKDILKSKGYTLSFGFMPDAMGATLGWDIKLDLKSDWPPARTFLHEMTHYLCPEMSEKEVAKFSYKLWKKLTHKEALKINRKIFR
jgi:hypothetical protein